MVHVTVHAGGIVYRVLVRAYHAQVLVGVRAHHAQVLVGVRAQDLFIIGNLNNII